MSDAERFARLVAARNSSIFPQSRVDEQGTQAAKPSAQYILSELVAALTAATEIIESEWPGEFKEGRSALALWQASL